MLTKKYREEKRRAEYALVSRGTSRVLEWFGIKKPSRARVAKAEARVQYYKHKG